MKSPHRTLLGLGLLALALVFLGALLVMPPSEVAQAGPPLQRATVVGSPAPTSQVPSGATPAPAPASSGPRGGSIVLTVGGASSTVWTAVQWQDSASVWHTVTGWQGRPDGAGKVLWWVNKADFGTGPFRWVVYSGPGGAELAKSAPFLLPTSEGQQMEFSLSATAAPAPAPAPTPAPVYALGSGLYTWPSQTASDAGAVYGTVYTVQEGDSLFLLAQRFGTTVAALQAANNLYGTLIMVGDTLIIPAGYGPSGQAYWPAAYYPAAGTAYYPAASATTYVVQSGDNLFRIGLRYGVTVNALMAANGLSSILIYPGQVLVIP